jgi:hypothetical protein
MIWWPAVAGMFSLPEVQIGMWACIRRKAELIPALFQLESCNLCHSSLFVVGDGILVFDIVIIWVVCHSNKWMKVMLERMKPEFFGLEYIQSCNEMNSWGSWYERIHIRKNEEGFIAATLKLGVYFIRPIVYLWVRNVGISSKCADLVQILKCYFSLLF